MPPQISESMIGVLGIVWTLLGCGWRAGRCNFQYFAHVPWIFWPFHAPFYTLKKCNFGTAQCWCCVGVMKATNNTSSKFALDPGRIQLKPYIYYSAASFFLFNQRNWCSRNEESGNTVATLQRAPICWPQTFCSIWPWQKPNQSYLSLLWMCECSLLRNWWIGLFQEPVQGCKQYAEMVLVRLSRLFILAVSEAAFVRVPCDEFSGGFALFPWM